MAMSTEGEKAHKVQNVTSAEGTETPAFIEFNYTPK
jgi:hypothetical protein